MATRGLSKSIDFTGGRNFKVQFENQVEPEQIRELIADKFGDANVSVIAVGTDGKTVRISTTKSAVRFMLVQADSLDGELLYRFADKAGRVNFFAYDIPEAIAWVIYILSTNKNWLDDVQKGWFIMNRNCVFNIIPDKR